MDEYLSQFIEKTGTDPSLARDLLESTKWDINEALKAFETLSLGSANGFKEDSKCFKPSAGGKAKRGLSMVNADIVVEARHKVIEVDTPGTNESYGRFEEMSDFTFVLPDLSNYDEDFGDFLRKDLIETSALVALEQAGRLNWWTDMGICRRLLPLATVGDGNCLLHAASLGMWGYHDRLLTLRRALYRTLTSHLAKGAIKRRWRLEQWQKNIKAGGLLYSEEEWEKEWEEVLRLASTERRDCYQVTTDCNKGGERQPTLSSISEKGDKNSDDISVNENTSATSMGLVKNNDTGENHSPQEPQLSEKRSQTVDNEEQGGALESLEDIHVFVLAHVLRRPIIIIADQFLYGFGGEAIAPIPFGGIYLPLECDAKNCFKSPLVLAFDSAHFSPLVPSEEKSEGKSLKAAVPLVDPNYSLLPLQFAVDPGEDIVWSSLDEDTSSADKLALTVEKRLELLKKYLDVETLKLPVTSRKDGAEDSKLAGTSSEITSDTGNKSVEKKPSSKPVEKKEKSWLATQILKVGTMTGMVSSGAHNNVYVARLQIDKKPNYYEKMIGNYMQSAKSRFEEEKKVQGNTNNGPCRSNEKPQPCISGGCSMFGTSATNYLCSGCYKTQKSYSETGRYSEGATSVDNKQEPSSISENNGVQRYLPPPSYSPYLPYGYFTDRLRPTGQHNSSSDQSSSSETPQSTLAALASSSAQSVDQGDSGLPSFDEVMQLNKEVGPSGATYADVAKRSRNQNASGQCVTTGCQFYGSPDSKGYCSACFRDYQKSSKRLVEDYEKSKVV
ncbi:OTU domain-containing protein 7B-like [Acropora muricata]|uniref:OTU domain-containing protein 7B-like n=1 Tax=Acropora muricata TaxID=159855 RepID=UPI0034E553CF